MNKLSIILAMAVFISLMSFLVIQNNKEEPEFIPPHEQRIGDAARGYEYLVSGEYVRGGIPMSLFMMTVGNKKRFLEREGHNKKLPHDYNAVVASGGQVLAAPNCLHCHAQVFEGRLVLGLGNSFVDFTPNEKLNPRNIRLLEQFMKIRHGKQEEAEFFLRVTRTVTPRLLAQVQGVNTADRLALLLAAHRDPVTFEWSDEPLLDIPPEVIPTDTPPWWLLKKKNAMFYNGFGRGDFGRFLMASNLLTVRDTSEARKVNENMPDVLAYLYSLEPPAYPHPIDKSLASKGRLIFENKCASCHGSYGKKPSYPNLLIPGSIVGTDSLLYTSNYSNSQFVDWFNRSWFTQGDRAAYLVPYRGYIAPPLDGIWITAPYLHNGSVPTIEAVLNSAIRPRYWSRDFNKPKYDYEKLGWVYSSHAKPFNSTVYNTDLPGYGNYGHTFGDALTDDQRKAVIEYLKTL